MNIKNRFFKFVIIFTLIFITSFIVFPLSGSHDHSLSAAVVMIMIGLQPIISYIFGWDYYLGRILRDTEPDLSKIFFVILGCVLTNLGFRMIN